jgi:hypothetical protein
MDEKAGVRLETEQSEAPVERLLPAPPSDSPSAVVALIERMALDARADAKKLERVIAMYERLNAKEAELAYNAAKGRILKKLAGIKIVKTRSARCEIEKGKPQKGTYEAFKYAPLEEIDKHLRPLLAEERMDLSYSDEPQEGGGILIRGRLKHLPAAIMKTPLCRPRWTRRVASRACRQWGAPILSCAATSPATSSTSWLSGMMTTEPEER